MISKSEIVDYIQVYRTRFNYGIESISPDDRANAEIFRLAAFAWQGIFYAMHDPACQDVQVATHMIIDDTKKRWADYVKTGIPDNDVQKLVDEFQAEFKKKMHLEKIPNQPSTSDDEMVDFKSSRKKKREEPKQELPAISISKNPIAIDETTKRLINPGWINHIVQEIEKGMFPPKASIEEQNLLARSLPLKP
jgi:hypothetical protein